MKVKAMLSIIPIGAGVSLSNHIATCERVLMESRLQPQLHAHERRAVTPYRDFSRWSSRPA